jgi:hypothetical protein
MVSIVKKQTRNSRSGRIIMFFFFLIFAGAGAGMLYPLGIRPIMQTIDSEDWPAVPCRIISAKVESHSDSDGTTYSIEITYAYEFNSQTFQCDRYDFIGGSSSGHKSKLRIVEQYKNAENPICYVNPNDPADAVLKRGFHLSLLFALFPLPFLAVGVGGLYWVIKNPKMKQKSSLPQWLPKTDAQPSMTTFSPPHNESLPVTLKSKSPWSKLLISIFVAAFWNGIVSVFVFEVVNDWRTGDGNWFLTLFLIPFVIVGIILIGSIFYCFLALFNPRPTLTLSSATIPLGGTLRMKWHFNGITSRINQLKITLKGTEEATYQRGTDTHTDKNTFYQAEIFTTQNDLEIPYGTLDVILPGDSMHSFEAEHNKIIWKIEMHGDIKSWPDVKDEYKFTVAPYPLEAV